jgi:hypothetical protein
MLLAPTAFSISIRPQLGTGYHKAWSMAFNERVPVKRMIAAMR